MRAAAILLKLDRSKEIAISANALEGEMIGNRSFWVAPLGEGFREPTFAAHDGSQWTSDFKQKDMWGGPGYRQSQPPYVIYRRGN